MDARSALGITNARQQTKIVRQLRAIRLEAGLTVDDLAREAELDPAFIVKFEKGGMNFTAATLRTIAKALGAELQLDAKKPNRRLVRPAPEVQSLDSAWLRPGARVSERNTFTTTFSGR